MSLPKFKGEYSEFKNFMSLFESFVHNDPTIPDIEKFNHLVSCLSGEALGTVKSFQMSEENYPKALASLKKVYDNKCLIFFNAVAKLFELSKILRPSASSLRSMIDTVSAVYDSLLSLGDDKLISNAMLIHIVMSKVDPTTRSKWEEQLDYDKLPLWAECETMLNKRYQHLAAEEASSSQPRPNNIDTRQKTKNQQLQHSKTAFIATNSKLPTCLHCGSKDHYLIACPKFKTLTALKRFEFAKSISLCINCLRKGHTVSKCKADRCGVCNRSHHTMLHQYPISFETEPQPSTSQAMHISSVPDRVMLATAVVNVKASSGVYVQARALLDSGSQVNFMTEELVQKLRIQKEKSTLNIVGIGKLNKQVQGKLKAFIKSRMNDFEFSADFWVMRSISANHPDRTINTNGWKIPQNIELADPSFYKCNKIDILLGAETFFDLLSVGQIKTSPRQPTLQKTVLGWIVSGKYASNLSSNAQASSTVCQLEESVASIDATIRKFWELEEIPSEVNSTRLTPEQAKCEELFSKTTQVLPDGRLQVRLPFKMSRKLLGHSFETAARRFQALERRTLKDPVLRKMYLDFMQEYLELGHMSPTNNRLPSEHLQIFRLNTVTYGTAPSPFLATRCLQMLSDTNKIKYPLGAKVIRNDFYVDDLLTGSDSIESLTQIQQEVNTILESAGLKLAKWFSNHPNSLNSESPQKLLQLSDTDSTKTLGIHWQPKDDIFRFILEDNFSELRATKRNILSVSARLFDPLGLLAPLVTKAKILLQELWIQKLDWDESIPLRLDTSWQNFKANLLQLPSISIPRYVNTESSASCQIHGFSDASIRAYGCCVYIRSQSASGTKSALLTSKSRVAPLKTKSLPRLELSAAHLLAKLWSRISPMLSRPIEKTIFWTDSEIVLHWIKTHPSALQTFVANRVSEIQEWTQNVSWRHVPTKQNPADQVSRGCSVDELSNSIWFSGPQFLLEDPAAWPQNVNFSLSPEQEALEKKKSTIILTTITVTTNPLLEVIERFSSHRKVLRIFAYVLRWLRKIRARKSESEITPTAEELQLSFLKIVEIIQHFEFSEEINKLSKNIVLPSSLQKLTPFLHEHSESSLSFKLIRVGGRLLNAPIPYDAKFPLLLSKNSHFVKAYIRFLHFRNHHAGPKVLVALLREKIWLVNAREACSRIVRECIHCFRYKPKLQGQIMGNLPADRLRAQRPFTICGVDYCGPIYITLKIRGRPPVKMYIAIFVCFASKAVHLELVTDLTADKFIFALKRFIGRRGMPAKIYCDNATNFVGAERKLRELREAFLEQKEEILHYAAEEGFTFAFIPPRAPHFGGLWEAAVKSAKYLLVRAVGNALLTAEETATLLVEIEAVLNSRPLAPLSNNPNDGEALTPAHLLIGCPLRALPPEKVPDNPSRCLGRWQLVCFLKQQFWRTWSRTYLLDLQQRNKWAHPQPNVQPGQLVVVQEDNVPPQQWVLGRIIATTPGADGKVRVAEIATKSGKVRRPIHKLAVLPTENKN